MGPHYDALLRFAVAQAGRLGRLHGPLFGGDHGGGCTGEEFGGFGE